MRSHARWTFGIAVSLAIAMTSPAQEWERRLPATGPSAREGHAMAYDPARRRIVLFGGDGGGTSYLADTWEWDGTCWQQIRVSLAPPGRTRHAMAWDAASGRVLLFGGSSGHGRANFADTWAWDGQTWTLLQPSVAPRARRAHAMVHYAASGRVLMFGGADDANRYLADTWEWDGSDWRERRVPGPSPRHGHMLAHDELRGRTVLFGGGSGGLLADTWEWDGAAWTRCTPAASPPARYLGAMAFHAELGRTVLFGGWVGHGHAADTWLWDGRSWTRAAPATAPAARGCHGGMAYDAGRGAVLLFGGFDFGPGHFRDTWEYGLQTAVFPAANAHVDGDFASSIPFAAAQSRLQTLLVATGFGGRRSGIVVGLEFRRDPGPQRCAGRTISLDVRIGAPATTANTMSTTFAQNWLGQPVLARSGVLSVPEQLPHTNSAAPFQVAVPFQQPYAWHGGDLLYELDAHGNTVYGSGSYELDAVSQPRARAVRFGKPCGGVHGLLLHRTPIVAQLAPGGSLTTAADNVAPNAIAIGFLGSVRAPLPWPGTGCTFQTVPQVIAAFPTQETGTANMTWPRLPKNPALAGQRLYSQWAVFEGDGAFPPLVLSDAFELTIGTGTPALFHTIANEDRSAIGIDLPAHTALVTRLLLR